MRPIETRFGLRSPDLKKALLALAELWGAPIAPGGGAAANVLGLITQNQIEPTCLTSGPDRVLNIGGRVRLLHAPRWQLAYPFRPAGTVIRALVWLGRQEVRDNLERVKPQLTAGDRAELLVARPILPTWMAEPLGAALAGG